MLDVRTCLARCCQSEDRKDQREGTGDYGEHNYTVVGKKHGFHHWPPLLCAADGRPELWSLQNSFAIASPVKPKTREPLMCSSRHNAAGQWLVSEHRCSAEFKVVRTTDGNQMRDWRGVRFGSEACSALAHVCFGPTAEIAASVANAAGV